MANGRRIPSTTTTVLDGSDEEDLVDDRDRVEMTLVAAKAWGARDARMVEVGEAKAA